MSEPLRLLVSGVRDRALIYRGECLIANTLETLREAPNAIEIIRAVNARDALVNVAHAAAQMASTLGDAQRIDEALEAIKLAVEGPIS